MKIQFEYRRDFTLFISLFFFFIVSYAQLKGVVINAETETPIPYVNIWVENQNIGTSSNRKGAFTLKVDGIKTLVFSAIGYQTKRISSDSILSTVKLKQQINQLNEVVLNSKKKSKLKSIGEFKKSGINYYYACTNPWIIARRFEYSESYKSTPYLDKITLLTQSKKSDSKFMIRLYNIGENGAPSDYYYQENIIGIAKKGKSKTEVDISELNIAFPENGFFVAVEWLIIDENQYEFRYTMEDSKEKFNDTNYNPSFGIIPAETNLDSWIFIGGNWNKVHQNKSEIKRYNGKFNLLAVELTLSN
jgi:hypothetical protein